MMFQPTPPRGRRHLARGASLRLPRSFNPRLRAGGDGAASQPQAGEDSFNPRLRAGGDSAGAYRSDQSPGFNPRLRAGGDAGYVGSHRARGVSTHASAREATTRATRPVAWTWSFNPRLRAGGDAS